MAFAFGGGTFDGHTVVPIPLDQRCNVFPYNMVPVGTPVTVIMEPGKPEGMAYAWWGENRITFIIQRREFILVNNLLDA